jgi:hypothetical protein
MEIYRIKKNYKDNDMKGIIEWDLLRPEDVEVRVATVKNGKAVMLLYQDGRCAVRALDRQFGSFGWQMDYKVVGDQIYGTLSIYDEEKQMWISKSDTGDKSNISEDKGQSSDILKRCIVRWGYATELYTAPKIEIADDGYGNTGYKVTEIEYDNNRKIIFLVIANRFGKEVFRWSKNAAAQPTSKHTMTVREDLEWTPSEGEAVNKVDYRQMLTDFCAVQKTVEGVDRDNLLRFFNFYGKKVDDWRGDFDPQRLWNGWNSKKSV